MRCKTVAQYPPFLTRLFCCLAGFLGESGDLGFNLGFGRRAKSRVVIGDSRTIYGRESGDDPDPGSGLIMGDFVIRKVSRQPLMRREVQSLRPHIFSRNHFLSGTDNGRDRLIRAQSRLGWPGGDADNSERISGELKGLSQIRDKG